MLKPKILKKQYAAKKIVTLLCQLMLLSVSVFQGCRTIERFLVD